VCVWQDGRVLTLREEKMDRGQDSRLVPMVQDVMKETGLSYAALDRIAVTRGPGSFTGLRIGLATARGMGLAADKPVVGVDRFSLFKTQREGISGGLLVVLESRRAELYVCHYPANCEPEEPRMLTPAEIGSLVRSHHDIRIVGDAFEPLRGAVDHNLFDTMVEAEVITCAQIASTAGLTGPTYLPRPLYIRPPDVTVQGSGT